MQHSKIDSHDSSEISLADVTVIIPCYNEVESIAQTMRI
jgi:hypothetical protein